MSDDATPPIETEHKPAPEDFAALAKGNRQGLFSEFFAFLKHNKKWWLLPLFILIGVLGVLVFMAGAGVGPFLYPLF